MPTWYHIIGSGQFFGTCKFHRYSDCPVLRRGRKIWCGPVQKWQITTAQTSVERAEKDVPKSSICQHCQKRYLKENNITTAEAFFSKPFHDKKPLSEPEADETLDAKAASYKLQSEARKKRHDELKLKFEDLKKSIKEQEKLLEFYREFVGKMTSTSDKNVAWKTTKEFSSGIMWQAIGNDLKTRYERHSFLFGDVTASK